MTMLHFGILALAYILGSIPFGVLVARARGVDIMRVGSGNTGVTNVYRTLGKGPGLAVFLLDLLKGLVPAVLANIYVKDPSFALGAGLMAVVGHSFSPWLKFKGGKGIASGLGALLGSTPYVAVSALTVFLLGMVATRYVSLSSIIAGLALPIFGLIFNSPPLMLGGFVAMMIFILVKHRPNIERLRKGTEPKFDLRGRAKTEDVPSTETPSINDERQVSGNAEE